MSVCSVRTERVSTGSNEAEVLVLEDAAASARAELLPSRGALLARWEVDGRPVLYLDESTLWDPAKSLRGGIPVLFPLAGRLPQDTYLVDGKPFTLRQHGFARNLPWRVVGTKEGGAAEVVLALSSSSETLRAFPFPFDAQLRFELAGRVLRVELSVQNTGTRAMPLHYGLHPYFAVSDAMKASISLEVAATQAYDNRTGGRARYLSPDFTASELDLVLLDVSSRRAVLHRPPHPSLSFDWAPDFPVMVLWTLRGKDYLCVEPWTAPVGALQTGESLRWLEPSARAVLPFSMEVAPLRAPGEPK